MAAPTESSIFSSMKRLWKRYIRDCRRRNIYWELDIPTFHKLTSQPCTYCGRAPAQVARSYKYNGLDRLNSKRGYEKDNVVPCCKECNGIKSDRLTFEEMKVVGEALTTFRKLKREQQAA